MVMVDQVCWNEMEGDGDLTLRCSDPECHGYERFLRRTLFQWKHFPVDMVVEPFIRVPKAIHNSGFGIVVREETSVTDPTNSVVGHQYVNQFRVEEDIEKIRVPRITHDAAETARRAALAHEWFDGLLEVRMWGRRRVPVLVGPDQYMDGCGERPLRPCRYAGVHAQTARPGH